jgi:hypothetical protein
MRGPNCIFWANITPASLPSPTLVHEFFSEETVIDHNQYVLRDHVFQSNYCAGLQVRVMMTSLVPPYSLHSAH